MIKLEKKTKSLTYQTVVLILVINKISSKSLKMMIMFREKLKSLRKIKIRKIRIRALSPVKLVRNPRMKKSNKKLKSL
jgi:hypothetical protein